MPQTADALPALNNFYHSSKRKPARCEFILLRFF